MRKAPFQKNESLKADKWMWGNEMEDMVNAMKECSKTFRETRDQFLDNCIETVLKQCRVQSADYINKFCQAELEASSENICAVCGCEGDVTFRKCRNCGGNLVKPFNDSKNCAKDHIDIFPYKCFPNKKSSVPVKWCSRRARFCKSE